MREAFLKAFWLCFIAICGVFVISHLAGCSRNGLGGYDIPGAAPAGRTVCSVNSSGVTVCKTQ